MKNFLILTAFLFAAVLFGATENTGRFDNITVNTPTKTKLDIKTDVDVQSTGGLYIPSGTTAQRPTPFKDGMLRFNSTTGKPEIYQAGVWGSVGGGISNWATSSVYAVGDLVVQSSKIYQAQIAHTSGTFATDLGAGKWLEISQGVTDHTALSNIGVNTHAQIDTALTRLANTSGTNTGDQDLSNYVDKTSVQTISGAKTFSSTISGNISGNAGTVTTNANLTGPITSVGNATSVASQTGTGSTFVMSAAPTITGHPTIEGVTATGATGTGKFVFDTSPTLVTPNIGAATGTSLTLSSTIGASNFSGTHSGTSSGTNTGDLVTKALTDGADVTTNKLTYPNSQATTISAGVRRVETGNSNLLVDPSFEKGTIADWGSPALGSITIDTTNVVDGAQSVKLNSAGAGSRMAQVSTTNAANLKGQQMVARAKVKTNDTALYVCGSVDSILSTGDTNCTLVPVSTTDLPFKQIEIPFIGGGTSNGIVFKSATTTSTNTYIDDTFVGTMAPFQNVQGAQLLGTIKWAATANCSWQITSTSYTTLPADTDCPTPVTTGQVTAPGTKLLSPIITSAPAGDYVVMFRGRAGGFGTANGMIGARFTDGTNTDISSAINLSPANTESAAQNIIGRFSYTTTQPSLQFQLQMKASVAGVTSFVDAINYDAEIDVYYYPPASKIYSSPSVQNSVLTNWTDYPLTILGVTTDPTMGATSVKSAKWRRVGDTMEIQWTYIQTGAGTAGSGTYLFPIPSGYSIDTSKVTTGSDPHLITMVGGGDFNDGPSKPWIMKIYPYNSTYLYGAFNSTISGIATIGSSNPLSSSTWRMSFTARVPIQGWSNDAVFVGSFAGIEKCANDYECTDSYTALVTTTSGAVSGENLDFIASCTAANPSVCTFTAGVFTVAPNCDAVPNSSSAVLGYIKNVTSTGFQVESYASTNGAASPSLAVKVTCHKTGVDFKPKTAKVASSIGVPTVPGITTTGTGNAIDTFSFSYGTGNATTVCSASPCSYLDQVGTAVSSITRSSAGNYVINFSKTYTKAKCAYSASLATTGVVIDALNCSSCSTMALTTRNSTNAVGSDTYGTLICQGTY